MIQMMQDNGFEYDCSAPSRVFGYQNMQYGRWPFTYDWYQDMDCQIEPCPQCSFPGVWSQPMEKTCPWGAVREVKTGQ